MSYYLEALQEVRCVSAAGPGARSTGTSCCSTSSCLSCWQLIDAFLGTYSSARSIGLLSGIYGLAVLIPTLAVTVRRLHDIDRTGWWILINLVPLIGTIVLLVFCVMDGTPGNNRYGPNPKGATARVV